MGPFKGNCSKACHSVAPQMVNQLSKKGKQCELKDSEGCWIKFSLEQLVGVDNYSAEIQSERGNTEQMVTSHLSPVRGQMRPTKLSFVCCIFCISDCEL